MWACVSKKMLHTYLRTRRDWCCSDDCRTCRICPSPPEAMKAKQRKTATLIFYRRLHIRCGLYDRLTKKTGDRGRSEYDDDGDDHDCFIGRVYTYAVTHATYGREEHRFFLWGSSLDSNTITLVRLQKKCFHANPPAFCPHFRSAVLKRAN